MVGAESIVVYHIRFALILIQHQFGCVTFVRHQEDNVAENVITEISVRFCFTRSVLVVGDDYRVTCDVSVICATRHDIQRRFIYNHHKVIATSKRVFADRSYVLRYNDAK